MSRKYCSLASALIGNVFEHYDAALFSLLAPFLAPLFFQNQSETVALILTYGMIPLGMLARPLGALFFGWMGDSFGRARALSFSLLGMGAVSVALALCPTGEQIGIFAPLFMIGARLAQNFFGSGEIVGGSLFLLENLEEEKRDFASSIYDSSTIVGILCASMGVSFLAFYGYVEQGWRLLYAWGALTALFGWGVRMFAKDLDTIAPKEKFPHLLETAHLLWKERKNIISIACVAGFSYACYSVALVLTSGLVPLISSITKEEMSYANSFLLVFDCFLLPLVGWYAARFSRGELMRLAALSAALFAIPLFWLLEGASLTVVLLIRSIFVILGVFFSATYHSWSQERIPKENRYLIASIGYALGTQLLGSPTAAISLWLYHSTGYLFSIALYWIFLALLARYFVNSFAKERSAEHSPSVGSALSYLT